MPVAFEVSHLHSLQFVAMETFLMMTMSLKHKTKNPALLFRLWECSTHRSFFFELLCFPSPSTPILTFLFDSSWFSMIISNIHLLFCTLVLPQTSVATSPDYTNCKLCFLLTSGAANYTSVLFILILIYSAGSFITLVCMKYLLNVYST